MFSASYWGGSPYHEHQSMTPFEKCRDLFIELRLELRKQPLNIDLVANLRSRVTDYPIKTQTAAFDAVVDHHGWG